MVERTKFDIIGHDKDSYRYFGEVTARDRQSAVIEYFSENDGDLEEVTHVLVLPQESVKNYRSEFIEEKIEEVSEEEDTEENKEEEQEILFGG